MAHDLRAAGSERRQSEFSQWRGGEERGSGQYYWYWGIYEYRVNGRRYAYRRREGSVDWREVGRPVEQPAPPVTPLKINCDFANPSHAAEPDGVALAGKQPGGRRGLTVMAKVAPGWAALALLPLGVHHLRRQAHRPTSGA